jgi:hypothetical protein
MKVISQKYPSKVVTLELNKKDLATLDALRNHPAFVVDLISARKCENGDFCKFLNELVDAL